MNDDIDPALIAILTQLWRASEESPGRAWSLAKLSKQSGLPMSSLQRQLTALSDTGLLDTTPSDAGVAAVRLSGTGMALCAQLFSANPLPDEGEPQ